MLLHNSNINVAIAVILVYQKGLWDLPGGKCKNTKNSSGRSQKGRGSEKCPTGENVYPSKFCYLGPN